MTETLQQFLAWVNAHPNLALLLLFLASLLDAIFIVGAFVPAAIVLFAVGALVTLGSVGLWEAVIVAAAGAVAGDGMSFWLGRRYGNGLFASKFFAKYPEAIANSRRFFDRYGVQGVMLARFLGPMRALTPALAGASGQRTWVFLTADSIAALAWAFAYIMPGVVFGASLGLAAEVAGRLAMLLLALVILLWIVIWLTMLLVRTLQQYAEPAIVRILNWSRRHRRLGKFGAILADSSQPETPALALLAGLLLAISGLWLYLVAGPGLHPYPSAVDATVFQTLRDLHTPWGLLLAHGLLQLGEWTVYGPIAVITFGVLVVLRKRRAAAHWLAALGFGAMLSLGLHAIPTLPEPYLYFGLPQPPDHTTRDLILASVIYAFLPVLLSTSRKPAVRMLFYGTSSVVLVLLAVAHLYVGTQWFTLAIFTLVVSTLWAALLGLGYRRHRPDILQARRVLVPIMVVSVIAVTIQWHQLQQEPEAPEPPPRAVLATDAWLSEAWRDLPVQRRDVTGRPKQALQLQWAGALTDIEADLRAAGWEDTAPLSASNMLHWLSSGTETADLPILPQVHAGLHPSLMLRLPLDEDRQYLIRLWQSRYRLDDGRPIWIGSISAQRARSFYRVLHYPVTETFRPPLKPILDALPNARHQRRGEAWLLWFDTQRTP